MNVAFPIQPWLLECPDRRLATCFHFASCGPHRVLSEAIPAQDH